MTRVGHDIAAAAARAKASAERSIALEEACDFEGASAEALSGGDPTRAARLAALARSDAAFEQAELALAQLGPQALGRAGEDLLARGYGRYAGRLLERAGNFLAAGPAYAVGGAPFEAALAFERGGKPAEGAKALERAITDDPLDDRLRRALAELLLRHGRTEGAVKTLQQMRPGPERDRALPLLARSLRALGLTEAAIEVERELPADPERAAPAQAPAEVPPPANTGATILFGRFEVVREVRKTPHAHLFEATDRISAKRVAVKILAASGRGVGRDAFLRFEREAKALRQLQHPTIVTLYEFLGDGPAMILEWMNGGSLADLMQREVFAPARAIEIACALLTALGQAHRVGILHRDVKPSNVLFDDVGTPKLADFGAAHLGDLSTTVTAGAIGTFAFMSPEQRLGRPATVQSDIYAVGALVYEMITGEPAEPLRASAGFVERPPSAYHMDLTPKHDELVAPFLAEEPEHRPADAFEARKRLESLRWPTRTVERSGPRSSRSSARPAALGGARLAAPKDFGDGRDVPRLFFDTVAERNVIILPLEVAQTPYVRAWARVCHPSLAAVLRASAADGQVWVEAPRGRCLADLGAELSPSAIGDVRHALAMLHAAGGAHGSLDREHLYFNDAGVFIAFSRAFAEEESSANPTDDLRALEVLTRHL